MGLDVTLTAIRPTEVFTKDITHNLGQMAKAADLYEALWRPEEVDITHARQLVGQLKIGLERLLADPDHFKLFNPSNGWGDYEGLVSFIKAYLKACEENPDATVEVSR